MTSGKARASGVPLAARRPLAFALGVAALVLVFTTDERVFGLLTDGQVMTRTGYAMAALGEIGVARGHLVDVVRPAGDAVTRYGMGPSLVRAPVAAVGGAFENAFGPGASQSLFVLEQILLVLLAALAAGLLVRACGADARAVRRAALAAALASPLWAYASSDWSEPLQAACVGGAFACAALAGEAGARRPALLAAGAGALAGFALLSKSIFVVLLPLLFLVVLLEAAPVARRARALAFLGGAAPLAALWLALEIARFGAPFASYGGERFSHPPLDGLWRLTVGPNKGLFVYFPLALLGVVGFVRLARTRRVLGLAVAGFSAFLLVTTAAWWSWDGTAGWGPRLLVPLVPAARGGRGPRGARAPRARLRRPLRGRRRRERARRAPARRRPHVVLRDGQAARPHRVGTARVSVVRHPDRHRTASCGSSRSTTSRTRRRSRRCVRTRGSSGSGSRAGTSSPP